jgi:hypothetical protein
MKRGLVLIVAIGCSNKDPAKKAADDYIHKSKATEAKVMLKNISARLKELNIETPGFPKGTAMTLPEGSCCPEKCPVTDAWAKDPIWAALRFHIDEPNRFHYSYTSDGTTFTATAVGELECDGKTETITATGKLENGNVVVTMSN